MQHAEIATYGGKETLFIYLEGGVSELRTGSVWLRPIHRPPSHRPPMPEDAA
jgi:hypothetical protein